MGTKGRYGEYGGQYIPETVMNAVTELEEAYEHYKDDPQFKKELAELYKSGKYQPETVDSAAELCAKLLLMFNEADITVIRTGLHSGGGVAGEYLAGAYHPAFKELCEGKIYINKAIEYIKENKIPQGKIIIYVARDAISKMTGQKRCNILKLKEMGYDAKITADSKTGKYQLYIIRNEEL